MTYKEYSFKELLVEIVDNRGKTCPTADVGIPLIATNCIKNEGLYPAFEKVRYVDQDTYDNWFRGHPKPGDMIFVCKGSPGNVCWVPDPVNFCIAQDMVAIRADESKVYPKFLFALLRSDQVQQKILNMHVGTLIPHFKKGDFGNLYLDIPENYEYQKVVGDAYFSFCEKIESNRQINRTLEEMAQAIFKSWFVDFEPVKAKMLVREKGGSQLAQAFAAQAIIAGNVTLEELEQMEVGYSGWEETLHPLVVKNFEPMGVDLWEPEHLATAAALFPSALQDSPLGPIPEGWEEKTFGDVSQCFDSKRRPLSKRQREEKKPGDIPYYGATSIMDNIDEWIFDGKYLLLGEDGSVIKEDGSPFVQYIWGKSWVNNHAHVLQGENGVSTEQLMLFIQSQNITAYITGAVQLKLNQGNMNSIPFLDAGLVLNNAFYDLIRPIYASIRNTIEENQMLAEIRDALLPKLLSGDISVGAVEKELEEVI